jgi:DNA polymerase III delta subunit
MIKECALWVGKFPMLFASDVEAWEAEVADDHDLQSHDIIRLSMDAESDIAELVRNELSDEDIWFSPRKVTIIRGMELLKSVQVSDLIDHLEKSEVTHHVALIQASGAILKRVEKTLTEKKARDFKIPDKPDLAATWGRNWLKDNGVPVSQSALKQLAEHCGEEQSQFASVLNALSTVKTEKELDWEAVRRYSGDIGAVKIFDITNAIARGDKETSVLAVQRLGNAHPLQLLKMLENRYRGYIGLLGGGGAATAEKLGTSTHKFVLDSMTREAKTLGEEKAIKSLQIILDTQRGFKGESALSPEDAMLILVIKLADQFARKK